MGYELSDKYTNRSTNKLMLGGKERIDTTAERKDTTAERGTNEGWD